MVWTPPMTATDGHELTSSQYNLYVRDNLLEMAAAKATVGGQYFTSEGFNKIGARICKANVVTTSQTTTSQTYTNLATVGPQVEVTHGETVVVWWSCRMSNSLADQLSAVSFSAGGDTHVSAANKWRICADGTPANQSSRFSAVRQVGKLTPGTSTFTLKYRVGGGTGTFSDREIIVLPL